MRNHRNNREFKNELDKARGIETNIFRQTVDSWRSETLKPVSKPISLVKQESKLMVLKKESQVKKELSDLASKQQKEKEEKKKKLEEEKKAWKFK